MDSASSEVSRMERLSKLTIEQAGDGIFWIDEDARIYRANKAICNTLGYTQEEFFQMRVPDFGPLFPMEVFKRHWRENVGKKRVQFESVHRTKDGRLIPVEITNNFIEFEGRTYACTFVHDISERKRREEELETLRKRLQAENVYLQEEIKVEHNFTEIIGNSRVFRKVLNQIEQVAPTDATVLILGETGTGKELLARAVHDLSSRQKRPLVKVNCAALPVNLIESELFGHERGAFTGAISRKVGRFELADGGTIFLDEIGDLPLELQAKLLRVLQEGEFERLGDSRTQRVDVRVIAATNRDLEKAVEEGTFREDLYYRLNVFPVTSPPLRERREDIPELVRHFVHKYAPKVGKKIESIPKKVINTLSSYGWPGNIRELENIIERSLILSRGNQLELGDFGRRAKASPKGSKLCTLDEMERDYILEVLELTGWRVSGERGAAEILGLKPSTLDGRMRKLEIKRKKV